MREFPCCLICRDEDKRLVAFVVTKRASASWLIEHRGSMVRICEDCGTHDSALHVAFLDRELVRAEGRLERGASAPVRREWFRVEDPDPETPEVRPSWAHDSRLDRPMPVRRLR